MDYVNLVYLEAAEDTLRMLDDLVRQLASPISRPIFRGVGNEAYTLTPSAFRKEGQVSLFQILRCIPGWKAHLEVGSYKFQGLAEAHALAQFYQISEESGADVNFVSQRVHEVLTSNVLDITESFWRETFQEVDNEEKWP